MQALRTMPAGYAAERFLHRRFAAAALGEEFFRPVPDLLAYVANPAATLTADNPLQTWLNQNEVTADAFAERVGIDPASLSRVLTGKRTLSRACAVAVEAVTSGAVPASYWVRRRHPRPFRSVYLGVPALHIQRALGLSDAAVSHWVLRRRMPTLDHVRKLVDAFPQITAQMVLDYHCPPSTEAAPSTPAASTEAA